MNSFHEILSPFAGFVLPLHQNYNILFREKDGSDAAGQIKAFEDTWHWDRSSVECYREVVGRGDRAAVALESLRSFLGTNDMMAYLAMMAARLIDLRRVLRKTGSLYLHCDPTASHYLKMLMDAVFSPENFRNEVIWKRTSAHSSARRFGPIHDVLLFYTKTDKYTWNSAFQPIQQETIDQWYNNVEPGTGRRFNRADLTAAGTRTGPSGMAWRGIDPTAKGRHWAIPGFLESLTAGKVTQDALDALDQAGRIYWPKRKGGIPMLKRYLDESPGVPAQDIVTDIRPLNNATAERLGYPTQKPEALLERIISASSNEGDVVLDPFCGCGTAVSVAEQLNRRWIGIDITHLALGLIKYRFRRDLGEVEFDSVGEPETLEDARALAEDDPYAFQWWVIPKLGWRVEEKKKGADGGIDGRIPFWDEGADGRMKQIIVSVKSGKVTVSQVRELTRVVNREKAQIGVLVSLNNPTRPMRSEAADVGCYMSPMTGRNHPKIQILTVADILDGKRMDSPPIGRVRELSRPSERTPKVYREAPFALASTGKARKKTRTPRLKHSPSAASKKKKTTRKKA